MGSPLDVFDTNSLRVFGNYYPESFPTFWEDVEKLVTAGLVLSVREVAKELEFQSVSEHLDSWADGHAGIFAPPSEGEMVFVAEIFKVRQFQQLIGEKQRLRGYPVADPFIVARAKAIDGVVVTEESHKPTAAKIPNVCEHFGVKWTNVKGFLEAQGWRY